MERFTHLKLRPPAPAKFIVAATYRDERLLTAALKGVCERYGEVEHRSSDFVFDHTRYYEKEMGTDLRKQFFSFTQTREPEELVEFKLLTMALESEFAQEGRRRVNLDPAYLELAKLVVATSKNFSHRIYIGKGVYGDVQLQFRDGRFVPNEWTYGDYRSPLVINFLETVRHTYHRQLEQA